MVVHRFLLTVICMLCIFRVSHAADPTPDVPLLHPVYGVLDRFEARGWFDTPLSQTRPFSRKGVARRLLYVFRQLDAGRSMSRTERGILERYSAEFSVELEGLGYGARGGGDDTWVGRALSGGNLYVWRDSVASVAIDPLFRQSVLGFRGDGPRRERVSQTYVGGILRGTFHDRFGFRIRHFEAREWSNGGRNSRQDVVARPIEDVQLKGSFADFREATFQLVWAMPWLSVDVGKGRLDWGPGRTGNLMLTDHAPPFALIRLRVAYKRIRYVHLAGELRARLDAIDTTRIWIDNGHVRSFLRPKRLAAHRLEFLLSKRVQVGLQEAVVYADRGFELLYVTPVTALVAVQNHLGNRDNLGMGADLSVRPTDRVQVYGALFLDDLQKFSPGSFANKFAFQAGVFWVDPVPDTDVRIEFVHLEPFVYSHNFQINTYEHYDALLGYATGPNADRFVVQVEHRFSPSFSASLRIDRERQGENIRNPDGSLTNVGGDAALGRRPDDPRVRDFLSGEVERRTQLDVGLRLEPVRDLVFRAGFRTTGADHVVFPDGIRRDGRSFRWSFRADFNFF
ncbi:MAG: hypothetical protein O7G87_09955 [bacterium]|nr:hypothetical protein [bacterium]